MTEVVFLGILPRLWNDTVITALLIASTIIIFVLAPYNHSNMDLSSEEIVECAKSAKRRLSVLVLFLIVLHILQFNQLVTGIIAGIVMVAVTLTFAYIPNGERQYEKTEKIF